MFVTATGTGLARRDGVGEEGVARGGPVGRARKGKRNRVPAVAVAAGEAVALEGRGGLWKRNPVPGSQAVLGDGCGSGGAGLTSQGR
ncbi:hypothetical protein Afil01_21240 [Actinorhabdospora filicis]|uniref:Uncharacterized protein n=1 Tax=Actinorhabdospora filicis TaxID=1785913 RepID=A0A9W6W2R9_9ACTN|nr:hypothetical protein Afil01_21240 [Actinorhabdospora filicis]